MLVPKVAVFGLLALGFAAAATAQQANPVVVIDTNKGPIEVELYADKAPLTAKNFLEYVDGKHYDGTIFHRVIDGFMIQGGGFDAATKKEKETRGPVRNEAGNGLSNVRGTIAMARTSDPDSATAQWYINVADNDNLDRGKADPAGYTVFGRVIRGMDVVDSIKGVRTGVAELMSYDKRNKEWVPSRMKDVPVEAVTIRSVRRAGSK